MIAKRKLRPAFLRQQLLKLEPDQTLTEDLKTTELLIALEDLTFNSQPTRTLIVDRGTRDYLVNALKHR
jgi:hypothetical protein